MNAIEEQRTIYKCSKCGIHYLNKKTADKCCPTRFCDDCGAEIDDKYVYTVCKSCREKRHFEKCEKLSYEDYLKKYPKCWVTYDDNYDETIIDFL